MSDSIFLDSNILVYCYTVSDLKKMDIARSLASAEYVHISTQVVNETTNVLRKKHAIAWDDLKVMIEDFEVNFLICQLTTSDSQRACQISKRYGYSFYDSLIISTALECNCQILYSEDLQHLQIIENKLKIVNPFL